MAVKRIVANIAADQFESVKAFYYDILQMKVAMAFGWIVTVAGDTLSTPQLSFAHEGGSGTPVPDLSIEIDNLDEVYQRALAAGFPIEYGPVTEPWGSDASTCVILSATWLTFCLTAKRGDVKFYPC
jgi:catechol 2,3-dioxygenase-like lactoylglutathione lyase family enzyme